MSELDRQPGAAWQPLTPRGVAAFAYTRSRRVIFVQFLAAVFVAASVISFLNTAWIPAFRESIRELPDDGLINGGQLHWLAATPQRLGENRYLAFIIDVEGTGAAGQVADLEVTLQKPRLRICSMLGCLVRNYPEKTAVSLARTDVEAWWGAWRLPVLSIVAAFVIIGVWLVWMAFAVIYAPVVKLISYFEDRELSWAGAWRLAAMCLIPGLLLLIAGIVGYGAGLIDLIKLGLLTVLHLFIGWVYLAVTPFFLQPLRPRNRNPFAPSEQPSIKLSDKSVSASPSTSGGDDNKPV